MIVLHVIAELLDLPSGGHMTTTYYAKMDETSTPEEKEHINLATNAIQKMIADKKGTGEFIERQGSAPPDRTSRATLWEFFVENHDLHLLDSELNDIIVAVRKLPLSE